MRTGFTARELELFGVGELKVSQVRLHGDVMDPKVLRNGDLQRKLESCIQDAWAAEPNEFWMKCTVENLWDEAYGEHIPTLVRKRSSTLVLTQLYRVMGHLTEELENELAGKGKMWVEVLLTRK